MRFPICNFTSFPEKHIKAQTDNWLISVRKYFPSSLTYSKSIVLTSTELGYTPLK